VERQNGVHQDRLVKKMRRQGIADHAAANAYLAAHYLPALNQRFAVPAARPENYHRPAPSAEELADIFRLQRQRWVSNDWVVRHHGRCLQLLPPRRGQRPRQAQATLYESEDGRLEIHYGGASIAFAEIPAPPRGQKRAAAPGGSPACPRPRYRPGPDHPYKRHANATIKHVRRRLLAKAVAARESTCNSLRSLFPPVTAKERDFNSLRIKALRTLASLLCTRVRAKSHRICSFRTLLQKQGGIPPIFHRHLKYYLKVPI
jgi:hypothetical protein